MERVVRIPTYRFTLNEEYIYNFNDGYASVWKNDTGFTLSLFAFETVCTVRIDFPTQFDQPWSSRQLPY